MKFQQIKKFLIKEIRIIPLLLFGIITLVACVPQTEKENPTPEDKNELTEELKNVEEVKTLSGEFIPPNFRIETFHSYFDENINSFELEIGYMVSLELYEQLKETNYYFSVGFPEQVQSIIDQASTDGYVKGAEMKSSGRLDYTIRFTEKIDKVLTKEEIKVLTNEKNNYDLYIANDKKETVHIFNDINLFILNN
ncbi:hypothetical protein [Salirhabdus salicampi]|uniref:hypothetical protein n=1 Tax=Salirhabdus salicampi TaxID=476102 RepID=UPI0020C51B46|nr:hypothetical protein [Salirhabdus salicampi]MCP8615361.1 hypothetical protein [Salirhabdus salicampi]